MKKSTFEALQRAGLAPITKPPNIVGFQGVPKQLVKQGIKTKEELETYKETMSQTDITLQEMEAAMKASTERESETEVLDTEITIPDIQADKQADTEPVKQEIKEPAKSDIDLSQVTPGLLQQIMAAVARDNRESILEAIRELKKPDPREAAKKEEEDRRAEKRHMDAVEQAKADEARVAARQANCSHKKENGKWSAGGQVMSGTNMATVLCLRCGKTLISRPAVSADYSEDGIIELRGVYGVR